MQRPCPIGENAAVTLPCITRKKGRFEKGRWDELWFVDLPDTRERTAIPDTVIGKYGREKTDYDPAVLSRASELHTGAEIEAAFVEALHRGFVEEREPTELDLGEVLCESVPLATTMPSISRAQRSGRNERRAPLADARGP